MKRRTPLRANPVPKDQCASCHYAGRTLCTHNRGRMKRSRMKRKTPMRPKRRDADETLRIYGLPERRRWTRRQRSVVSGRTPCVNAHVKTGGMGRKADRRWIVPLTYEEHEELHRVGTDTFEEAHGVDLLDAARRHHERWQAYEGERAESEAA